MKYALKNLIMILVWSIIFFRATSVNLTETEQLIIPTGILKILMRNLACQTQKRGSWCSVVYCQMDSLVLTFSMKQSRVQHDSGLCIPSITTQETVLST